MAALSLTASSIISLFLETIFYAIYVLLFCGTVWILVWRSTADVPINKAMLSTTVLMFIIATLHIAVDLQRSLTAFVDYAVHNGGPESYLNDLHDPLYIFKSTLYTLQTLIGDAFLLFRVYVIWNREWRVCIAPLVLLSASIITGMGALAYYSQASPNVDVFASHLRMWMIGFFVPTFLSQILCTCLLAFRIWRIQKDMVDNAVRRNLIPLIAIIVESGAVYAVAVLVLLAIYAARSWAEYMILDILPSLIGIVFSLIIVRTGATPSLRRQSICSSRTFSTGCKLDTLPEQFFYPPTAATLPLSPLWQRPRDVEYSSSIPVRPLPARLTGPIAPFSKPYAPSPPLPPIPLVLDISKETCYDYDYDTCSYTPSLEQLPKELRYDGRTSPSSEARGTYYASSWTGSVESFEDARRNYIR